MADVMFTVYTVFYAVAGFVIMLVWLKLKGRRKQRQQNEDRHEAAPGAAAMPLDGGETVSSSQARGSGRTDIAP